jgi:two-component system chemotaxis response regulator CheB
MDNTIKVLVVDDSSLMRKMITQMIVSDPAIEVINTAMNGYFALQKIEKNPPDIILLDIEMPQMDGVEFLKKWKELNIGIPVIVLSSLGKNRPELTVQCIELGAKDFILKPSGTISLDIEMVKEEVIAKIKFFYRKRSDDEKIQKELIKETISEIEKSDAISKYYHKSATKEVKIGEKKDIPSGNLENKLKKVRSIDLVVIGISTGGPNALRKILPLFSYETFKTPIVIVQHMPPGFTKEFSRSLNEISSLTVKEAEDFEPIKEGCVYIAPGGMHMLIDPKGIGHIIRLDDAPPVNGHKPSVEILFNSVAEHISNKSIALIMTGMGKDGARAIKQISLKGGITIAQEENSCVVYGMPKAAVEIGGIDKILDLVDIPQKLQDIISDVKSRKN